MRPKEVPLGYKFAVVTTYLSTPHSIKIAFLEYKGFYLAIQNFTFYEFINCRQ